MFQELLLLHLLKK